MVQFGNDWDSLLSDEFEKPYYKKLRAILKKEYTSKKIYPDMNDIFNALKTTPFNSVKAVIIGQDPYHGEGQAHGMCFSVKKGIDVPPSLVNIFTELHNDLGLKIPNSGDLTKWAESGVLLLNNVLTVRAGQPNSHKGIGWEFFTDKVIKRINEKDSPVVYLLWGANAKAKASIVTNPDHLLLKAAHPSPFSASNGFFGCRHFSKANTYLKNKNIEPIDWSLE